MRTLRARWRVRLDSKTLLEFLRMIRQHTQLDNTTHFLMKSNSTDHRPVKHKSPSILSSEHVAFKAVLSVHLCVRDNLSISFLLFAASSRSNHIARWKALAREKRIKTLLVSLNQFSNEIFVSLKSFPKNHCYGLPTGTSFNISHKIFRPRTVHNNYPHNNSLFRCTLAKSSERFYAPFQVLVIVFGWWLND